MKMRTFTIWFVLLMFLALPLSLVTRPVGAGLAPLPRGAVAPHEEHEHAAGTLVIELQREARRKSSAARHELAALPLRTLAAPPFACTVNLTWRRSRDEALPPPPDPNGAAVLRGPPSAA
jgi:hypothetical protein